MRRNNTQEKINKALNDVFLRRTLSNFTLAYRSDHQHIFSDLDFQKAREATRAVKEEALSRLPQLLKQFAEAARARGAQVYLAETGEDACRYIVELAARWGARLAVKSKSMATEEIHLNRYLEAQGVRPVETDLGEWVIQIAQDRPSHMVLPTIHKSKEQVAQVISGYFGRPIPPTVPEIIAAARAEIRRFFLEADIGITGANFAVAETGAIVLVSNEGNARITAAVPPVHVVVVGIEKIVPRMRDLGPLLRMLPRAATGQKSTSYVTFIAGATGGGNREVHVVLLDNGRRRLYEDPVAREALYCLRCSSCLNVCPVYELVGGHVFGGPTYPGGIGAILTAYLNGLAEAEFNELCLGCRTCHQYCPVKIDIPGIILHLREKQVSERGLPLVKRVAYRTLTRPRLFHGVLSLASRGQTLVLGSKEFLDHLPGPLSRHTAFRSASLLARTPLRQLVPRAPDGGSGPKVAIYAGCVVDFLYPRIGLAAFEVLRRAGFDPYFPSKQSCCGAPAAYGGDAASAAVLARQNVMALSEADPDYVVYLCPTCGVAVKHDFPRVLADDPVLGPLARGLAAKSYDFSEFAVKVAGLPSAAQKEGGARRRITYHEPCHLGRHLGVVEEPRMLLRSEPDLEYVEMGDSSRCCGFAGSYTLFQPEISRELMLQKLARVQETGAELVATACPGCIFQLRGGLRKRGKATKVLHVAEVLAGRR